MDERTDKRKDKQREKRSKKRTDKTDDQTNKHCLLNNGFKEVRYGDILEDISAGTMAPNDIISKGIFALCLFVSKLVSPSCFFVFFCSSTDLGMTSLICE